MRRWMRRWTRRWTRTNCRVAEQEERYPGSLHSARGSDPSKPPAHLTPSISCAHCKLPSGSTATTSPSTFNQRADIKKQSPGTFFWLNRQVVKKNRTNQQIYRSVPHSPCPPIIYLLFCQSSIWKIVSPPSGAPQILLLISILFFPQNSQESSVYEKV